MIQRCRNPRSTSYPKYGGRGITVCERWHVFENFLADMGERISGTSLDRIDNDRGYEPGNCRWTSARRQQLNRRVTKIPESMFDEVLGRIEHGESQSSVARRIGCHASTVSYFLKAQGAR